MNTAIKDDAIDLGFKPDYAPMTEEQTKNFIIALMTKEFNENADVPFGIKILDKRIEVLELPIKFTLKAKILSVILTDNNPGKMVILLIDALTKHENETIDDNKLVMMYPIGFYSMDSFIDYVNNYIKPCKVKWSEIH